MQYVRLMEVGLIVDRLMRRSTWNQGLAAQPSVETLGGRG